MPVRYRENTDGDLKRHGLIFRQLKLGRTLFHGDMGINRGNVGKKKM